ncbi:hypothetical protein [Phenylobacterium sp.]|uniref:hypothetical protein n=1 Tax=Phenylobacterium sp. TaxID=1871053 RepID=UPI0012133C30|nr:hypothetical protein [Phenylobacterium sp.]THD66254.1 MAG: hypothetical protein E8A12_06010 [Phenylobacterium sp.]
MIGSVTTYGGLSLTQGAMTYAVTPGASAGASGDQPQPDSQGQAQSAASAQQAASELAATNANLTPATMSALIQAQASLVQDAPAMIRQHTAETIGQMIWRLDQAPPLSPAPMAVRQLQAARMALTQSLVDLRA